MLPAITKDQILQRLLEKYSPRRIILFGSQARGTADSKSDVDILVIVQTVEDRFVLMREMTRDLSSLRYAFDVIVLSDEEFEREKKYPGTVSRYAAQEGIILYER